jgi:hypothetical protein
MRTKLWAATGMALAACAGSAAAVEPGSTLLNITPVPEPGSYTLALMAVTIGCIALLRRKPK